MVRDTKEYVATTYCDSLILSWLECGPGMYGGFNSSNCLPCPENSINSRDYNYNVDSCSCLAGHTGQNGGPCTGKNINIKFSTLLLLLAYAYIACGEGTFKPNKGNVTCQDCPLTMSSEAGSVLCSCASGYEPTGTQCTG